MPTPITTHHRTLAESLARAVGRPGENVERIAQRIADDEAAVPTPYLAGLRDWIAGHGFRTRYTRSGGRFAVEVEIPWANLDTGQRGIERHLVRTYTEARALLCH